MRVDVQPVKDGPDYAPAVTITVEQPGGQPWEPQLKVTLDLETASDLNTQLRAAIHTIDINADPP